MSSLVICTMQAMSKNKKLYTYLLLPITLLYFGIVYWRNLFYKYGFFISKELPCKVISIGNITTGGTGKTPTVIFLCELLKEKGHNVAILSRGYKRSSRGTLIVSKGSGPEKKWEETGDEPQLMALRLPWVPIVVDQNRYRGGLCLIKEFSPDIILMDDGFQHRAIVRDFDFVLINSNDSIDDHRLLPLGRLREPWNNIKRANALIITKVNWNTIKPFLSKKVKEVGIPTFKSSSKISISRLFNNMDSNTSSSNYKKAYIVSGIGDTKSFHLATSKMGYDICGHSTFSDHFSFSQRDLNQVLIKTKNANADVILTTEKDWVKLQKVQINFPVIVIELKITIEPKNQLYELLSPIIK